MTEYSSDRVFNRLSFVHEILAECIDAAFSTWTRDAHRLFPGCRVLTKRRVMHELMVNEARLRLGDRKDVRIVETRFGHFLLAIPGQGGLGPIVVRFKYLDARLRTKTYPTPGAVDFDMQRPLEAIPRGIRLTCGYQLNRDETDLAAILMVYSKGSRVFWHYELPRPGSQRVAELPAQRSLPAVAATPRVRVRRNQGRRRESQADE